MSIELSIQAKSVQSIFQLYTENSLIVNRRYQRKLVWSIEEKEKFIDSLIKGYPIPMILASRIMTDSTSEYEILDGLQRLNAITSFIEGDFSVSGNYFNLSASATTAMLLQSGKANQKNPTLSIEDCAKILNYQIPFSIAPFSSAQEIDETFRRINTGGRRLSKHDVRQAGAIGEIPDAINQCAIYIRKDSSRTDRLTLSAMKNISIGDDRLGYGIRLRDIFWSKHKIILPENIKASRDEELVAHLISFMLSKDKAQTSSYYLDKIYDIDSEESQELSRELNAIGLPQLVKHFAYVFDELEKIIKYSDSDFRNHVFLGPATKTAHAYQVIFLSLHHLLIEKNETINNYKAACDTLKGSFNLHMKTLESDKKWSNAERRSLIEAMSGVLKKHTSASSTNNGLIGYWAKNLENILNESRTEQPFYDYKCGLIQTTPPGNSINEKTLSRAVKTLTAMTNSTIGDCYVIFGVSETKGGAENHKSVYGSEWVEYSNFFIVGINDEAESNYSTIEGYKRKIVSLIDNEPISDEFKRVLKSRIVSFKYSGKEVLILIAKRDRDPQPYGEKFFKRESSDNKEIPIKEMVAFVQNFASENT